MRPCYVDHFEGDKVMVQSGPCNYTLTIQFSLKYLQESRLGESDNGPLQVRLAMPTLFDAIQLKYI